MPERLDGLLGRWCEAWQALDVPALVAVYNHDAAWLWKPMMERSDAGHLGLTQFFSKLFAGVTTAEAVYGRSIGDDRRRQAAPFRVVVDDMVYEGLAFFLVTGQGFLAMDRRFPGPMWRT